MIKRVFKSLLTFGIIGLGIINFSNAVQYQQNIGYNYINPFSINISGFGEIDYNISSRGVLSSYINGSNYNFLYFRGGTSNYEKYLVLGWKNGKLYGFIKTNNPGYSQYRNDLQGYFDKFAIVQTGYDFSYMNSHMYSLTMSWDNALEYLNSNSIIGFHGSNGNDASNVNNANGNFMNFSQTYVSDFCFITNNSENPYLCFFHSQLNNPSGFNSNLTGNLLEIIPNWDNLESWNGFFGTSPVGAGGNGGNGGITVNFGSGAIELGSDESAVNYYEKAYGRDESICYVGVDNYTDLYGTRVSFEDGSGLTIFEVFNGLYGNTDLDRVYKRINAWVINYEEWSVKYDNFSGPNPTLFAFYNSGTNQVDYVFTGLETSPFIGQPVAIYFMANNIYDKSPYSTMGSSVVSYCNLKLLSGTYEEIIDEADKNNITAYTEQSNKNLGLNPDGTVVNIDFGNFGSWTGESWLSSGVDIAFSGNTSVKNTLKNFFTQFDSALSGLDISTSTRILPTWLVTAFLFVVLFKFLRKRS